jgi:flagellar protein FlaI
MMKSREAKDNPTRYVEVINQHANLSSPRNEKDTKLIETIKKDSLTKGEIHSSINNPADMYGRIKSTSENVNIIGQDKSKYDLDPLSRDAMAIGVLKKENELMKNRVKEVIYERKKVSGKLVESYNDVEIIQPSDGVCLKYNLQMPDLQPQDWKKIKKLKDIIIERSKFDPTSRKTLEKKKSEFKDEIKELIAGSSVQVPEKKLEIYVEVLISSMVGYGFLEPLLNDDQLEEIMVLGENQNVMVYHRKHGMCSTNIVFQDDQDIVNIISRMAREVGRKIDILNPLLDSRLHDGSRVNATIRPITPDGATLTIRKFRLDPMTVIDLINNRTFSLSFAAWLWAITDGLGVEAANVIVSGGTSSGKTTTLNTIASFIPERERLITIEDTLELQLRPHKHWIKMETREENVEGVGSVNMNDCLINALRMRPDRIVIGEVRGDEAKTLFTAMNTGHDGCMGTLHANDAKETITRLTNSPMDVPKIMVPALNIIIMQNRFNHPTKGSIRRITEVAELAGMESGTILTNKTFKYDIKKDELVETGVPSRLLQDLAARVGISGEEMHMEIGKRRRVLQWLVDNKKRSLQDVKTTITNFTRDPDEFLSKIT